MSPSSFLNSGKIELIQASVSWHIYYRIDIHRHLKVITADVNKGGKGC